MNFWDLVDPVKAAQMLPGGLNPVKSFQQMTGQEQFQNPLANVGFENLREGRFNMDTLRGTARGMGENAFGRNVAGWVDANILGDVNGGMSQPPPTPMPMSTQQSLYQQMLARMIR